jgi:nitroreductase
MSERCIELILERRSIRRYKDEAIPEEVLRRILEAGRRSPSAANRQPWHFVVVSDEELKKRLATGRYNRFIRDAAVVIVGVALPYDPVSRRWAVVDVTIAMQSMVLAAWVQGVGSCWVGDFGEGEVKRLLGIPEEARVVALLTLGIPDEAPPLRPKKRLEEIVHQNRW